MVNAAAMLHDGDYLRTRSSKKNAMHERKRFVVQWGAGERILAEWMAGLGASAARTLAIALSKIGCARRDGGVE